MGHSHVTGFSVAAILFAAATSHAQPAPPASEADRLFEQARTLLAANRAGEACPLLQKSYALDPARGTLLNLAGCYKLIGHNAEALRTFRTVHTLAVAATDQARIDASATEIAALEKIVHRLAITVGGVAPADLEVTVNSVPVAAAERGDWPVDSVATPLAIHATAAGRQDASTTVTLPPTVSAAPIPVVLPELAPIVVVQAPLPPPRKRLAPHRDHGRVVVASIVAGAGVVLFGASVGIALKAKGDWDDAGGDACLSATQCDAVNDARSQGNLATGIGIAGLAAVATGIVLFVTAPKHADEAPPIAIIPMAGGALASFGGRF